MYQEIPPLDQLALTELKSIIPLVEDDGQNKTGTTTSDATAQAVNTDN